LDELGSGLEVHKFICAVFGNTVEDEAVQDLLSLLEVVEVEHDKEFVLSPMTSQSPQPNSLVWSGLTLISTSMLDIPLSKKPSCI
jgi:hypothetical protein